MAISIAYRADTQQALRQIRQLNREAGRTQGIGTAATAAVTQRVRDLRTQTAAARAEIARLRRGARGLDEVGASARRAAGGMGVLRLAAIGVGAALLGRGFISGADFLTNIQNRLRPVTGSFEELLATQTELENISRRVRNDVEPLVGLYQRLAVVTDFSVNTQQDLFNEIEGLSAAFRIGGSSAIGAAQAVEQYAQAASRGVFEGEELKTLLAQSAPLARALQLEFDTTAAGLRQLNEDGELTFSRVQRAVRGLVGLSDQIADQPITIRDSFRLLVQEARLAGGEFAQLSSAGSGIGDLFTSLRESVSRLRAALPELVPRIVQVATILGGLLVARLAAAAAGFVATGVAAGGAFLTGLAQGTRGLLGLTGRLAIAQTGLTNLLAGLRVLALRLLVFAAVPAAIAAGFLLFQNDAIAAFRTVRDNATALGTILRVTFQSAFTALQLIGARTAQFLVSNLASAINSIANFDFGGSILAAFRNLGNAALGIFNTIASSITTFFSDQINFVIDNVNSLVDRIRNSGAGRALEAVFGTSLQAIERIDLAGAGQRVAETVVEGITSVLDGSAANTLGATVEALRDRLASLGDEGRAAAQVLSQAFSQNLSEVPELVDVIRDRFRELIDNNPGLRRLLDAVTGQLEITTTQVGGAGGQTGVDSSSGGERSIDDTLRTSNTLFSDLNQLIGGSLLGTLNQFVETFQTVRRIADSAFGEDGLLSGALGSLRQSIANGQSNAGITGDDPAVAATNALTRAVASDTAATQQGTVVSQALGSVTSALGAVQTTATATETATTATLVGGLTGLTANTTLLIFAVQANTAALLSQQTADTISAISTAAAMHGGVVHGFRRGTISVPGSGRGDSVPALLEPGEVVVPNRAPDRAALAAAFQEEFGQQAAPQVNFMGDLTRATAREFRRMLNEGVVSGALNQREIEAGGQPVFRS